MVRYTMVPTRCYFFTMGNSGERAGNFPMGDTPWGKKSVLKNTMGGSPWEDHHGEIRGNSHIDTFIASNESLCRRVRLYESSVEFFNRKWNFGINWKLRETTICKKVQSALRT